MPEHADDDATNNVDAGDDDACNRISPHELRGSVHRPEEGTLLLQFGPSAARFFFVDETSRQVSVDRHLLSGNGVEREPGPHLRNARGAFGDDDEVDCDQNQEDDEPDDKVATHDEL